MTGIRFSAALSQGHRFIAGAGAGAALLVVAAAAPAHGQIMIRKETVGLPVGETNRTVNYYFLKEGNFVDVEAQGPTLMNIKVRGIQTGGIQGVMAFGVRLVRDNRYESVNMLSAPPDANQPNAELSDATWIQVRIPDGRHIYRLSKTSDSPNVLVRVSKGTKESAKYAMAPETMLEAAPQLDAADGQASPFAITGTQPALSEDEADLRPKNFWKVGLGLGFPAVMTPPGMKGKFAVGAQGTYHFGRYFGAGIGADLLLLSTELSSTKSESHTAAQAPVTFLFRYETGPLLLGFRLGGGFGYITNMPATTTVPAATTPATSTGFPASTAGTTPGGTTTTGTPTGPGPGGAFTAAQVAGTGTTIPTSAGTSTPTTTTQSTTEGSMYVPIMGDVGVQYNFTKSFYMGFVIRNEFMLLLNSNVTSKNPFLVVPTIEAGVAF